MSDDMTPSPAPAGANNKIIYIVIGVVVVLAVLGFAARSAGILSMRSAGVNVQTGPNGSATYTTDQGSVTVGGNKMPDTWPSDVPANYSGATIQYSGSSNPQTGQAGAAVVYVVQASASAIVDYYKTQLTAQDWEVQSAANMGATSVVSAKKEARVIGISVTDAGNGTVQVSVGLNI